MNLYDFLILFKQYQRIQLQVGDDCIYDGEIGDMPLRFCVPQDKYVICEAKSICEGIWVHIERKGVKHE